MNLRVRNIQRLALPLITVFPFPRPIEGQQITELFPGMVRINRRQGWFV
jgi:hypothetical protein